MKRHYVILAMVPLSMAAFTLSSSAQSGVPQSQTTASKPATSPKLKQDELKKETDTNAAGEASLVPQQIEATPRSQAAERAKTNAGRANPFSSIADYKRFPSHGPAIFEHKSKIEEADTVAKKSEHEHHGKIAGSGLIPPPPPGVQSQLPGPAIQPPPPDESLPMSELPMPPSKPSIADKLKLTGIIENKAIFTFTDNALRRAKKWPRVLALSPGEQFETLSVLNVSTDSVTLEEDGERTVKELMRIK